MISFYTFSQFDRVFLQKSKSVLAATLAFVTVKPNPQNWRVWKVRHYCALCKKALYITSSTVPLRADQLSRNSWWISCVNATRCLVFNSSLHICESFDLCHIYRDAVGNREVASICKQILRSRDVQKSASDKCLSNIQWVGTQLQTVACLWSWDLGFVYKSNRNISGANMSFRRSQ
jgi:hypothetical protein